MYKFKVKEMLELALCVLLYSALRGKTDCYTHSVCVLVFFVFCFFLSSPCEHKRSKSP